MDIDRSVIGRRSFLKAVLASGASVIWGTGEGGTFKYGDGRLPRVLPESLGIDSSGILGFVEAVDHKVGGLHSFMLLRRGRVAAEGWWAPYRPDYPHMLYSLSKSFCSTGVGLAVSDGKLTVNDPVVSFFNDDLPAKVSDNLTFMKVRDLLTMSTGHDKDTTGPMTSAADGNWVKAFLALPVEHKPGSKFVYNSGATYMLSAIVRKVTGQDLLEYLKPRLFDPLGIRGQSWEKCPRGISIGGWGLSVKTEDIARFGQLYLQKGNWKGKPLIPESWVAEATSKQVSNGDPATGGDWNQGYGYQFWRCRHGHYRGDGAFGQFCIVMPDHDAVLAITSGVGDMGAIMNAAWEHLLPAFKPSSAAGSAGAVKERIRRLSVPAPQGSVSTSVGDRIYGKTYRFEANPTQVESIELGRRGNRMVVALRNPRGTQKIEAGHEAWLPGRAELINPLRTGLNDRATNRIAARGAWTSEDTYTLRVCFLETPYVQTTTLKFADDRIELKSRMNVGFGPTEGPLLSGKAV